MPSPIHDPTEAEVRVGRTLRDKWHLDALIDVGGMAAVYAATHRNGMRGAVKILHRHRSLDTDIAARFRREGYIANKVAHPNAVRVLDDDIDDDGSVFLVMELLEGATLRDRACNHGGTLPPDEVLLAVDQLLDVLAVAHDAAIVHRDVKPENVFVTTGGQVKILDFGIARLSEPSPEGHSATMAGLPLGSPAFMSPEQARGRWDLVDAQSDVWSVGAMMFALLSGQDVHAAETVPELLAAIFTVPARSLAMVVPDSHPALVEVVDGALQLRLADRWQDARKMQAAVRRAYFAMYGAALPLAAADTRLARPKAPHDETLHAGRKPTTTRGTSTAIGPGMPSAQRQYPRRLALAFAFALAGVLGIAGTERDLRSQEPPQASEPRVELGEQQSRPSTIQMSPSAIPELDVPSPPSSRPPPPSSAAPVFRGHHPSIYDRRY